LKFAAKVKNCQVTIKMIERKQTIQIFVLPIHFFF